MAQLLENKHSSASIKAPPPIPYDGGQLGPPGPSCATQPSILLKLIPETRWTWNFEVWAQAHHMSDPLELQAS